MSRNDDFTTGHLSDYYYHQNWYNLIGINLSRKTNATIPQCENIVSKNIKIQLTAMNII